MPLSILTYTIIAQICHKIMHNGNIMSNVMLIVITARVIMLSVIMLNIVILTILTILMLMPFGLVS